jgi:hypothetical protein
MPTPGRCRAASSITIESSKTQAVADPDRARLLTDAERAASSITGEFWKAIALSAVAKAAGPTDPDRAARLLTDAERIANSITDESSKATALSAAAKAAATTDPKHAERIANSITDKYWQALSTERHRARTRNPSPYLTWLRLASAGRGDCNFKVLCIDMDDAPVDFRARLDGIDPTLRGRCRGREVAPGLSSPSRAVSSVPSSLVKKSVSP